MVLPNAVHDTLRRHLLVDGYEFVLDTARSRGSWIVDARDGARYLDLFTFFASAPLGISHPALADNDAFRATLTEVALNKPSSSDVYTTHLAEFVETFARVLGDPDLPHLFLIEGGTLAVENALKVAFDWKQQHNAMHGRDERLGTRVLHLTKAFHGRSGYTLSLTNTEAHKIARFPKFDWPRIDAPIVRFPLDAHHTEVEAAEARALDQARAAFAAHPDDIACFIAEPIQGEGGDNHLRAEFLQAMERLCRAHDALLVIDEVQTGCGATGTAWAYQQLGLRPDIVAFGKKLQVCGIMAGGRVDEVAGHALAVSSRLNSTWGGNLTDMVRARRFLEVIESEGLIDRAATLGKRLLCGLEGLAEAHPSLVDNVRGRGLLCAFDLADGALRDEFVTRLRREERVVVLAGGERAVRLRPALVINEGEIELAVAAMDRVLGRLTR
ncbi:MAG: L-lysine 6-transaminase [Egibacteraceae bacterium]